jgi:hypothetical protein
MAGEGGMASVWKAQVKGAAGFSRTVAIKKIKSEFRSIKNYTEMFIEEARVGSELAHPNIVQVYDFCVDPQGTYYIVMEWVEGMDLGGFVKAEREAGGRTPWPLVVVGAIGTLRGLAAAHERRRPDGTAAPIVHRDVSPHNILLGSNGAVKLTDFGLARARDRMVSLTAPGTVKGKLSYLSPEVAMGGQATPASDLFAMGAVMWESLDRRAAVRWPQRPRRLQADPPVHHPAAGHVPRRSAGRADRDHRARAGQGARRSLRLGVELRVHAGRGAALRAARRRSAAHAGAAGGRAPRAAGRPTREPGHQQRQRPDLDLREAQAHRARRAVAPARRVAAAAAAVAGLEHRHRDRRPRAARHQR